MMKTYSAAHPHTRLIALKTGIDVTARTAYDLRHLDSPGTEKGWSFSPMGAPAFAFLRA